MALKSPIGTREILGLSFVFSAAYHLVGLIWPAWVEPSPAVRHGVFVALNGLMAFGVFRRTSWVSKALLILVIQQIYSHGTYGWKVWIEESRIDWASVLVLLFLPLLVASYLRGSSIRTA